MKFKNSDRPRLLHIRDAILEIMSYIEEDPARGNRTLNAVIRQLEVVGEASHHLSIELRERYSEVPWHQIINMRHHLVHGYYQVSVKNVWDTVDNDLQPLLESILVLIEKVD